MTRPTITPIPCLKDNYCYLLNPGAGGGAWLVDPSEPGPPMQALAAQTLALEGILLTHHHWDHVGGVGELLKHHPGAMVAGHAHDRGRIEHQTIFIEAPAHCYVETELRVGTLKVWARHIPGHTLGAIAWVLPANEDGPADVFTGDTLFAGGCGRLFEGTPAMMHGSLQALTDFPDNTRLWFGHEYTAANLRFAAATEPDNLAVTTLAGELGPQTTPTTVGQERATNPFVRAADVEALGRRREAKDNFGG